MPARATRKMIDAITLRSKRAAASLTRASPGALNRALRSMARLLRSHSGLIRRENEKDIRLAKRKGLSVAMVDRLTLSDKTLSSMVEGLQTVAALPCPVGQSFDERVRPNGLRIRKVRAPIGVVAIIYESRPNVTVDAASICLKSHNAALLRGGSEAFNSNRALASLFGRALKSAGLPAAAVQLIPTTDRRAVDLMLRKDDSIDVVIPRGGESLIRTVVEKSNIPVIKHYKGVCHVFVSRHADMRKALPIVVNAKVQRPGVCNAMETLLLDTGLPSSRKKQLVDALLREGVTMFGDASARSLDRRVRRATVRDWESEYLDLRLAVKCVGSVEEAVDHINTYGSGHTDAIVSESKREIEHFLAFVDSSSVIANASTRFSDGGEYGMGCEIGISTDKLHARGPMGVDDLTTYKWVVEGNGQIRR